MPESLATKFMRWGFNYFPSFRGTGGKIVYIFGDWREVRIKLPLTWRTRNYVGTIYGGSCMPPLTPFTWWCSSRFTGPSTPYGTKLQPSVLKNRVRARCTRRSASRARKSSIIKTALASAPSVERIYHVELRDAQHVVCASIEKTVYIRRKMKPEKEVLLPW